ncbi:MAG: leucine-rich repeat protein [Ruminococcus sp.]
MNTTKILSLLLAAVILISTVFSVTAFATDDDGIYKNFKYTVTDENSAVISKYTGNESSVKIPESINGYPVTEIGDSAFKGNFSLKNAEIHDGVKIIGDYAFNDCTGLESITIPESVEKIGKSAFFYCTRLENVNVSDGIKTIGDGAFFGCYSLKSFKITESVNSVGEYAFGRCSELKSVTVENGIKSISNQMFADCTSLNEIVLPNSIESIGRRAFLNCSALENLELPDSIDAIADYAFYGCSQIKNLSISAKTIGDYAFSLCSQLESVSFSDNLETIGDEAFKSTGLSEVSIPSAVSDIGKRAFATNKIEKISVAKNNQYYTSIDGVLFNKLVTEIIDYPNYTEAESYAVPQSVTSIGEYAFGGDMQSLKTIIIPGTVTEIGNGAFMDFYGLEYIYIPDSVTEIGDNAFNGCLQLASITIPYSVTEIGDSAFRLCSSLQSVSLTEGLKSIGDYAFSGDYELSNITLPNSLNDISPTAFFNSENFCEYLTDVSNPYFSVTDGVLYSKDKSELVSYPFGKKGNEYSVLQGTESIGDYAIICNNIDSVYVPQSVKKIGKNSIGFATQFTSDSCFIKPDFMVYGAIGSAAEEYCLENDLAFFTDKPSQNIEVVSLNAGENATFRIENANPENVVYSTSDKSVADVDSNGKITANSKGTTQIIASVGIMNFLCTVNVKNGVAQPSGYTYSGFDTSTYSPITKQAYQDWEDAYYSFNESNPPTRLDNPAIYCYTTSEYIPIMAILVGGFYLDTTIEQRGEDYRQYETIADNLSMELNRYNADSDMLLYSGTDDVSSITGKTFSLKDMKEAIGKSYVDGGVVSTSVDHGVADHFGDGIYHTVLEVYAPKSAIKGAYISKMSDYAAEYEYLLDKKLEYQVIDAGVRNVTFTGYTTEEPTNRVERYVKLRIVDNSKPDEPSTTEPTTGTVEPSTSVTEATTQQVTQAADQTTPTQAETNPSDAPVATGDNAFAYCVPALLMLGAISVFIYTKRKSSDNK